MSTAGIIASRRWTEQAVTFDGDFDRVTRRRAGTAPGAAADPGVDRRAVAAGLTGASAGSPTAGSLR